MKEEYNNDKNAFANTNSSIVFSFFMLCLECLLGMPFESLF